MYIPLTLIQSILLLVVPLYSQKNCQKEDQEVWYFIYNTTVKIKTYYCVPNDGEDFSCEKMYSSTTLTNSSKYILSKCHKLPEYKFNNSKMKIKLCELPAQVNLLTNMVTLTGNITCLYNKERCYNPSVKKYAFWTYKQNCENIIFADGELFDVWTIPQNKTKFISNYYMSLLLTEETQVCGADVWKTNYNGIIASTNDFNISLTENLLNFEDTLPKACELTMAHNQNSMNSSTWYIYKYPLQITVYYCVPSHTSGCEQTEHNGISQKSLLEKCRAYFTLFAPYSNSYIKVCQKIQKLDLRKDKTGKLHSNCTFSSGFCSLYRAFWFNNDLCSAIEKAYEGYREEQEFEIIINKSLKFSLLKEGQLCGAKIWYTSHAGLVASQKELQFSHPKTALVLSQDKKTNGNTSETSIFQQGAEDQSNFYSIKTLGYKQYLVMVPFAIHILWIVITVAICMVYLCTKRKEPDAFTEGIELRRV